MGDHLISILVTVGASTWIYTKLQNHSGNNTRQSMIATAIAAAFIYIVLISILSLLF